MSAVMQAILQMTWAMHQPVLDRLVELGERHARGERLPGAEVALIVRERDEKDKIEKEERPAPTAGPADPPKDPEARPAYEMHGSVAVVPIEGVIAPKASMVNGVSQPQGMSVGQIVGNIAAAAADPRAKSVLLDINSPGGGTDGIDQVVDAVKGADAVKPVHAYARTMASAAYWVGSAARSITSSRLGNLGSIGIYAVVEDRSAQQQPGVRKYLVKAGKYKGIGAAGMPISEQDLGVVSEQVNALYSQFVSEVAANRGLPREKALDLADGRVHMGAAAVALGLADRVATFGQVIEQLNQAPTGSTGRRAPSGAGRPIMSSKEMTMDPKDIKAQFPDAYASIVAEGRAAGLSEARDKPATIGELKAAFKADPGFALEAAEKGLTLTQAKAAYADVLAEKLAATDKALEEAKRAQAPASGAAARAELEKAARSGNPVGFVGDGGAQADASWEGKVKTLAAEKFGGNIYRALNASASDAALQAGHAEWVQAGCPKFWKK